jgi:hypothetical protein
MTNYEVYVRIYKREKDVFDTDFSVRIKSNLNARQLKHLIESKLKRGIEGKC